MPNTNDVAVIPAYTCICLHTQHTNNIRTRRPTHTCTILPDCPLTCTHIHTNMHARTHARTRTPDCFIALLTTRRGYPSKLELLSSKPTAASLQARHRSVGGGKGALAHMNASSSASTCRPTLAQHADRLEYKKLSKGLYRMALEKSCRASQYSRFKNALLPSERSFSALATCTPPSKTVELAALGKKKQRQQQQQSTEILSTGALSSHSAPTAVRLAKTPSNSDSRTEIACSCCLRLGKATASTEQLVNCPKMRLSGSHPEPQISLGGKQRSLVGWRDPTRAALMQKRE